MGVVADWLGCDCCKWWLTIAAPVLVSPIQCWVVYLSFILDARIAFPFYTSITQHPSFFYASMMCFAYVDVFCECCCFCGFYLNEETMDSPSWFGSSWNISANTERSILLPDRFPALVITPQLHTYIVDIFSHLEVTNFMVFHLQIYHVAECSDILWETCWARVIPILHTLFAMVRLFSALCFKYLTWEIAYRCCTWTEFWCGV